MRSVARLALAFGFVTLSCSSGAPEQRHANVTAPEPWPDATPASVAHRDPRLGVPSFVWITRTGLPHADSAREAASATLRGIAHAYELSPRALASIGSVEIHDSGAGPVVARWKQRVGSIEVFRGGLSL